jgi:Family of unknown function (DUF6221)
MTADLTGFLAARLDEDERELVKDPPQGLGYANLGARMRREVEAKRAILGRHRRIEPDFTGAAACAWCSDDTDAGARWHEPWPCPDVLSLAAVYRDHPEYRQEWVPDGTAAI